MIKAAEAKAQAMIAEAEVTVARAEEKKRQARAYVDELFGHVKAFGKEVGFT
jgi:hypothetical protein